MITRETHLYEILSVPPNATNEEISRSYKKIALKCHPDKTNHNPQLTEKFKEATRAYEILKDANKRKVYDYYGESGLDGTTAMKQQQEQQKQQQQQQQHHQFHVHTTNVFTHMFDDINSIFSNTATSFGPSLFPAFANDRQNMKTHTQPVPGNPSQPVRGQDIHHTFKVTLSDLYYGKVVKFQLPKRSKCLECQGQGSFHPQLCDTCKGLGRVMVTMFNQFSKFQEVSLCKKCEGSGIINDPADKCLHCNHGYIRENKIIKVNILPGSKNGDKCILQGEGDEGRNVIPGDVIIHLQEISHPYLIRKYNDLYAEYDIDLKTALLGGSIVMKNFISPGQSLKVFINTHGISDINDSNHDMIQMGEIVGTIDGNTPKIVKNLGMPINESIIDNCYYQDPNDPLELTDVIFDLKRYRRGNLFIKFNIQLPKIKDFAGGASDLSILSRILPTTTGIPTNVPMEASIQSHLSNIPERSSQSSPAKSTTMSQSPPKTSPNMAKKAKTTSSSGDEYDYNDIDIDDKVDGVDKEEEEFYQNKWASQGKKRKHSTQVNPDIEIEC